MRLVTNFLSVTIFLSLWKTHFSFFCNFLSDKIETIFWESEEKRSKLFKSKFSQRKLLLKLFWSYLELKNECPERLKRAFFSFLQIFPKMKLKPFSGKARQCRENVFQEVRFVGSILGNAFQSLFDHSSQSLLEFF